jgi:iron complex outermembrane receptor protein
VTDRWKISPGDSLLRMSVHRDPTGQDPNILQRPGDSPRHQFELRSFLSLPKNLEWDGSVKYVASLPSQNIPAYVRVDSRLGWRFGESLELSVSGQNLATRRHLEFLDNSGFFMQTEVSRSVAAKVTWRY